MAKCRLWVYNAEIFCGLWTPIRTSDSTDEAKFKKGVFLGHPIFHSSTWCICSDKCYISVRFHSCCIYVTSLHSGVQSHDSSQHLLERVHNHTGCICDLASSCYFMSDILFTFDAFCDFTYPYVFHDSPIHLTPPPSKINSLNGNWI